MSCPLSGNPCNHHQCFHITDISKGKISGTKCCTECITQFLNPPKKEKEVSFLKTLVETIDFLTKGLMPQFEEKPKPEPKPNRKCPKCDWDAQDVIKTNGKLGCPYCYTYFAAELQSILALMHNTNNPTHVGKKPKVKTPPVKKTSVEIRLKRLQEDLQGSINTEHYERASEIKKNIEILNLKIDRKKKIIKQMQVALQNKDANLLGELRKVLDEIDQE